jgi:hypothetical protein
MTTNFLSVFNDHFEEFINDIQSVFPHDVDILTAKNSLLTVRKANPKLLVRIWLKYVVVPYQKEIEAGDLQFFINKDYSTDLSRSGSQDKIMTVIDRFRKPVKEMSVDEQEKSMKYIQNLAKLALLVPQ